MTFDRTVATDEKAAMDGEEFHDRIPHHLFTKHEEKDQTMDLQVGNVSGSPTVSACKLGVYFDQSMKMYRHISQVCQTAYFQLSNIAAIRPLLIG